MQDSLLFLHIQIKDMRKPLSLANLLRCSDFISSNVWSLHEQFWGLQIETIIVFSMVPVRVKILLKNVIIT